MAESLDRVKERVRECYLGKCGIHGVGISRAKQAIRVYVGSDPEPNRADLLEQVRKLSEPYSVIVVEEERPRTT